MIRNPDAAQMTTDRGERILAELAKQLHEELLRRGLPGRDAPPKTAAALQFWGRAEG
jgi:hypothetical protein